METSPTRTLRLGVAYVAAVGAACIALLLPAQEPSRVPPQIKARQKQKQKQTAASAALVDVALSLTNAMTQQAVAGVEVILLPEHSDYAGNLDVPANLRTTSSALGRAEFRQVPRDSYDLFVAGYRQIHIDDWSLKHADLMPVGTIRGQVLNSAGEPIVGAIVEAFELHWKDAEKDFIAHEETTDENGKYEIRRVPGQVVVRALVAGGNPRPGTRYEPQYFPNAHLYSDARRLVMKPGQTANGIDFLLQTTPAYRIRGVVSGSPSTGVGQVRLWDPSVPAGEESIGAFQSVPEGNSFTFENVPPGTYRLTYNDGGDPASFAFEEVTVKDQDPEAIPLHPARPVDLRGIYRPPPHMRVTYSKYPVALQPFPNVGLPVSLAPKPVEGASIDKRSGEFRVTKVAPSIYVVALDSPAQTYAKSIRFGDKDFTSGVLDTRTSRGPLLIELAEALGELTGQVTGATGTTAAGAVVRLAPAYPLQRRIDLYRTTRADANGAFHFAGLPPVNYRILAWVPEENPNHTDGTPIIEDLLSSPEFLELLPLPTVWISDTEQSFDTRVIPRLEIEQAKMKF